MRRAGMMVLAALAATGCSGARQAAEEAAESVGITPMATARAELRNAQGVVVGTAELEQHPSGIEIDVDLHHGVAPGVHGIHVHAVGSCVAPTFDSAGPHFNPTTRQHGFDNAQGPHAGDLRNLEVRADGTARVELDNQNVTLTPGPNSLFDADGAALVIHAAPDDYRTDPSGNSGARIACGVITR